MQCDLRDLAALVELRDEKGRATFTLTKNNKTGAISKVSTKDLLLEVASTSESEAILQLI